MASLRVCLKTQHCHLIGCGCYDSLPACAWETEPFFSDAEDLFSLERKNWKSACMLV